MSIRQKSLLAMHLVLGLSAFGWSQEGNACSDGFSTGALGSNWSFIDLDNAPGGSANVAGGKLELVGKGKDIYDTTNQFVGVYRQDIKGDFDVSVKIESQDNTHAWAQAGILVANDAADLKKGGYAVLDVSPGNAVNLFYDSKLTPGTLETRVGKIGTTAYPIWFRIKKIGTKYSSWYKTALDAPWKVVAENFAPQLTQANSHIGLISLSHNVAMDAKTIFDDFTCLHNPSSLPIPNGKSRNSEAGPKSGAVDILGRKAWSSALRVWFF